MAFPTRVATVGFMYGYCGPFISSSGNVYVLISNQTTDVFYAYKATDPTSSFSSAASFSVTSAKNIQAVDVYQVGDVLHVATSSYNAVTSVDILYHTFDMSSDTWSISNEAVKTAFDSGIGVAGLGITVRSDGDVIILYNGAKSTSMGGDYGKVKYARREAAAWTIDVAVDDAVANTMWYAGMSVLGASDRSHFTLLNSTLNDVYERTLNSSNTLGTLTAVDTSYANNTNTDAGYKGVSYVSGANTVVWHIYRDTGTGGDALSSLNANSADTPTYTSTADITGSTAVQTSFRAVGSLALDGTTVYCVFIEDSTNDLKYLSHADGGSWGSVSAYSTVDARSVNANIYTRGSDVVLAVIYGNGADGQLVYYDEVVLRTTSSFASGAASITATATATWNGKSTATSNFNQAATAALTWNGAATAAVPFTQAAAASLTWVGSDAGSIASADWSSTATAALTWNGSAFAASDLTATATALLTWNGAATAASSLSAIAASTVTWNGAAISASALEAAAVASLTWIGNGISSAAWSAAAAANLTWAGTEVYNASWSSAATAALTWNGSAFAAANLSAAATGTLTWNGAATAAADLSAAAIADVQWISDSTVVDVESGDWSSTATGSLVAAGASIASADWNSAATASLTWGGNGIVPSAWAAAATASLAAAGAAVAAGVLYSPAGVVDMVMTGASTAAGDLAADAVANVTMASAATAAGTIVAAAAGSVEWVGQEVGGRGAFSMASTSTATFGGEAIGGAEARNLDGWRVKAKQFREAEEAEEDDMIILLTAAFIYMGQMS